MKEGKWEIVIEEWYLFSAIQFLSVSWKICWIGVLHWVKRSWKKTPGVFQSIAWYNWDWTNQNWYKYCQRWWGGFIYWRIVQFKRKVKGQIRNIWYIHVRKINHSVVSPEPNWYLVLKRDNQRVKHTEKFFT